MTATFQARRKYSRSRHLLGTTSNRPSSRKIAAWHISDVTYARQHMSHRTNVRIPHMGHLAPNAGSEQNGMVWFGQGGVLLARGALAAAARSHAAEGSSTEWCIVRVCLRFIQSNLQQSKFATTELFAELTGENQEYHQNRTTIKLNLPKPHIAQAQSSPNADNARGRLHTHDSHMVVQGTITTSYAGFQEVSPVTLVLLWPKLGRMLLCLGLAIIGTMLNGFHVASFL
ncbi:hypothetical protein EVAR_72722_1 [Eumeta japonica]|uniref:Uncharacterized protein n=1 Tax=Eumeta variegata TaxID=151549 RepID=A0A4C1S902_EUMVA|nr:hypothetical protein EVAR_72722_1 [Eumeta japonica]